MFFISERIWEKLIDGKKEIIYVTINGPVILYTHVLDPKTIIEMKCLLKEFSIGHEIALRIKDNFGTEVLKEILHAIKYGAAA